MMQVADFQKFRDGIAGVMGFYGKSLSTFALDVWWTSLRCHDLGAVVDAFNRHLANPDAGQFAPKPADIIRMLQGSTQDAALRAWVKVDRAVRSVGTYCDVVFDDALIHRVIQDMGGWIGLGTRREDEWPFVAKEFENRYRGYAMRSERPPYLPVLAGIASAQNSAKGYRSDCPVLVGNEQAARQVLAGGSREAVPGFKRLESAPPGSPGFAGFQAPAAAGKAPAAGAPGAAGGASSRAGPATQALPPFSAGSGSREAAREGRQA